MKRLSQDDIEKLLIECGTTPTLWKGDEMMVCCPVHGERHPSMGVNSSKQIFHCFSCGAAGNFPWLLFQSQPDQYKSYSSAVKYIEDTFHVYYDLDKSEDVKRYEDLDFSPFQKNRKELPLYKLAPFKSGKETYRYFFDRGFTKKNMSEYMIGRDTMSRTVTIPVFYEDGVLAGVIGRYISANRRKNERYKVYDHFNRGSVLFPIDKFEADKGVALLVEGQLDAIYLRNFGYKNVLAKMGVTLTQEQCDWLCDNCSCVINIGDNDQRGKEGREKDRELIGNRIRVLEVYYPEHGKDVLNWSREEIQKMILGAHGSVGVVKRYE